MLDLKKELDYFSPAKKINFIQTKCVKYSACPDMSPKKTFFLLTPSFIEDPV